MIRKTFLLLLTAFSLSSCKKTDNEGKLSVGFLLKSKGNQYFVACEKGAREAADELDLDLRVDGPISADPAKQNEIVENWITDGVDVIVAACENRDSLSTALNKARESGIKVVTYDADAQPEAREFFANQATAQGIGEKLIDTTAGLIEKKGKIALITGTLTSANMNEWISHIKQRSAEAYPEIEIVDIRPCDDNKDKAQQEATNLLSAHPDLKAIVAVCSPAVPGAAEAVKQAGKTGDVKVVGLGLPSENRAYVKEGVTQSVILWNPSDLGYLATHAGVALAKGDLAPGATTFEAGRLGALEIEGDSILLGTPFEFTAENIDDFDF